MTVTAGVVASAAAEPAPELPEVQDQGQVAQEGGVEALHTTIAEQAAALEQKDAQIAEMQKGRWKLVFASIAMVWTLISTRRIVHIALRFFRLRS